MATVRKVRLHQWLCLGLLLLVGSLSGCSFISRRTSGPSAVTSGPWRTFSTRDFLAGNVVLDIKQTAAGGIYLATWNGITRFSENEDGTETWYSYGAHEGLPPKNVTCLTVGPGDKVWAGCGMAGDVTLARLDGERWTAIDIPEELTNALIVDLAFDKSGQLWIATWGGGVFVRSGESWTHYTDENGLPSNFTIVVTPGEDEVWIGTKAGTEAGKGACRFHDGSFETFDEHDSGLVDNNIHAITFQGDYIWFGSWGGANQVNAFDNLGAFDNWRTYASFDNRLPDSFVRVITVNGEQVWFGTDAGLTMFDNEQTWITFTTTEKRTITFNHEGLKSSETVDPMAGLASNHIFSLLADTNGRLWVGTDQGVSRYTPE